MCFQWREEGMSKKTNLSKVEYDEQKSEEDDGQDSASDLYNEFSDPVFLREVDVGQDNKGSQESEQEPVELQML